MDFDYLEKLSAEEIAFLAEFCQLHYHGSPHRCGNHIQISECDRKASYAANHAAERDLYTQQALVDLKNIETINNIMIEDMLIELLDIKLKKTR